MKKISLALASFALVATPLLVHAEERTTAPGSTAPTPVTATTRLPKADFEVKAKARALEEIDRRVKKLGELSTRIGEMKKLTDADKTALQATITSQISALNALRTKIEAETDLATLKADIKSITESYRIYALLMPQLKIIAAADRIVTVVGEMAALENRIALRIASSTGDTSALVALDTALKDKLTKAQSLAQEAVNLVVNLQPDNGDKTVMQNNRVALQSAHTKLREAHTTLKLAREDIRSLLKLLTGNAGLHRGEERSENPSASGTP
ncbi:MAG: hypothetical protein RIQ56_8 [Candidatus Parcubacteria bacterium]|jgi:hypothetical protein